MEKIDKRIVVVEDDEIILEFLEMVFATETMEVIRARDGDHGLEIVAQYQPDAVVCDLHMRGKTGIEVLRGMRRDPVMRHIPFVMLTADQSPAIKRRILHEGADAFVAKPFDPDELISTLHTLTNGRNALTSNGRPGAGAGS